MMRAGGSAWLALALALGRAAAGAPVNVDELARCAAIAAGDTRLACYDALAHRVAPSASAAARAPLASTSAPLPATAAPPSASPPPPAIVEDPKNFGLSAAQQHVEKTQIKSEEAQIVSIAHGEPGQSVVVLDNGQSWKVSGDDGWVSKGDKVKIKRASLGSFLMLTPSNHTYSVRRMN